MTLVASLVSAQSTPFMISDTLLTSHKINTVANAVTYPTIPLEHTEDHLHVVGLCQKIVEIRPDMFVGWSGSYTCAARFISNMRLFSRSKQITYKSISAECNAYFKALRPQDIYDLSVMILYYEDGYYHQITANSATLASHDQLGDVTVIGSGSIPFLNYVSKVPLMPFKDDGHNAPLNSNRIHYCLSYIALTLNHQKHTGFGIEEGWGGGFEIVLSKSGGGIEKLDRVMYLTFVWWFEKAIIQTSWVGSRYFSYISGNHLNILSQERHKSLKRHIALPPDCTMMPGEQNLYIKERTPQLLCINLHNRDTGKSRTVLAYDENGLSYCGVAALPETGESIRANSEYVISIIRRLASQDAT